MQQIKGVGEGGSKIPQREKIGHLEGHEVKRLGKDAELGISVTVQISAKEEHTGSKSVPDSKTSKKTDILGRSIRFL